MHTKEGVLLHEVVHLSSIGQMKRLLSLAYPHDRLPAILWRSQDGVLDAVFHEHVNMNVLSESVINAKYCRHRKGGDVEWEAAYHLEAVRDLAFLERGDVASVLNADSCNAFAAMTLMQRVESTFANGQNNLAESWTFRIFTTP
ncbi:hypothetical protein GJ744_012129 [Endocarpon pusillum]|uniref:Uncharacterized protein n=1 Tax=Endocarpon pusillum TaxID=364733 RepID=A0A8H7AEB7_9EURO|nr:hypothetical protein GJ744_012129 [Endocarpon pusillum]